MRNPTILSEDRDRKPSARSDGLPRRSRDENDDINHFCLVWWVKPLNEIQQSSYDEMNRSCLGYTRSDGLCRNSRDKMKSVGINRSCLGFAISDSLHTEMRWDGLMGYAVFLSFNKINENRETSSTHLTIRLGYLSSCWAFYTGRIAHGSIKCAVSKNIECTDSFVLVYAVRRIGGASY